MKQHFEWNEDKNKFNIEKHKINFFDAANLFKTRYINYLSLRNNEERMVALGKLNGRVIAVVYTMRKNNIRIISARMARRSERALYTQQTQKENANGEDN